MKFANATKFNRKSGEGMAVRTTKITIETEGLLVIRQAHDFGEVAGAAENTTPGCPTQNSAASLYQYYQYKPVLWRDHAIEELATMGRDPVGTAVAINNHGEALGITGICGASNLPADYYMNPLHAVLWEKDGTH
jgi:hypothetical protein